MVFTTWWRLRNLFVLLPDRFLLTLQTLVLLLQFVQEHWRQFLVLHRFHLSIRTFHNKIGKEFGDLLGNETVIERLRSVLVGPLVSKGDGSQQAQTAAGFA